MIKVLITLFLSLTVVSASAETLGVEAVNTTNAEAAAVLTADASVNANAEINEIILPESEIQKIEKQVAELTREEIASKSEAEIPVVLEKSAQSSAVGSSATRVAAALALLAAMFGTFVWYVRRQSKATNLSQQTQIKVLTQHHLGPKKQLAIIRVAGETILIGVTDQNINHIRTLSLVDEEIPEQVPNSFQGALQGAEMAENSEDDFAISGIRDFVSKKLKNMRTLE